MKSLKSIVRGKLLCLTAILMIAILLMAIFFQTLLTRAQAREDAEATFSQIHQIIRESAAELETIEAEYRQTCLLNGEVISYIIRQNPSILGNVEEFRQLAVKLEVDEIHIFDETGRIFTGTHPEYYDFTFESGDQMRFFKPMLTDKSLRLCQDITPNTAEGKPVQYSALWTSDQKYIVQVGMYPDAVLEVTEKNELSYIFSLLRGNPGVTLYAMDYADGRVIGSGTISDNDKLASEIGFDLTRLSNYEQGAHATVKGVNSYCVMENVDGTLIAYVISEDQLYSGIGGYTLMLALCLLAVAAVLVILVLRSQDRYILHSISETNRQLRAVADGYLDERVEVRTSREFSELSSHINSMIGRILADTDKMSLVLNRTNLHIGVYEYNTKMKHVRFTEHVPEIFGLSEKEMVHLSRDRRQLEAFIDRLRREPVPEAENTYRLMGKTEMYVKLEEITNESAVLGIVMDVTEEIVGRKRAEEERDRDLLTGLCNRRSMERQFERLFADPKAMGYGALIMIDSDNLKEINDNHGHAAGDRYLRAMAELLIDFDAPSQLAARVGGDEFVLLIYGYESDADVQNALPKIQLYQQTASVMLEDGTSLPLEFSYGYELTRGRRDFDSMLSVADSHMYNSKRMRKKMASGLRPRKEEESET